MKKLLIGLMGAVFFLNANAQAPELAATCVACHGENGVSSNTLWPHLAGQQPDYLAQEMRAFRDGVRVDQGMPAALLEGVSDTQITELADYYSALEPATPAPVDEGSPGQHVRANCVSCHGMAGVTVTSIWPNLAAQQEAYLKKQLLDYRSGKRDHPIMVVIANELTEEQIAAVAKYYSQH